MLLSLTVIALLFGGGVGGYISLQKRTAVDQATMNIKKDIEHVKLSALLNRRDSDENWISAFAILLYMDGNQVKYRKLKFCTGSLGYSEFVKPTPFNSTSFRYSSTRCNNSNINKFVSFEDKSENLVDKRVQKLYTTQGVRLILFKTITGEVQFYKKVGANYVEVASSTMSINFCSSDNKAKRGIDLKDNSSIQFVYGSINNCP